MRIPVRDARCTPADGPILFRNDRVESEWRGKWDLGVFDRGAPPPRR